MIIDVTDFDAYKVSSAVVNYNNMEEDTLSMTRPYDGSPWLTYKQEVILTRDEQILIRGRVSSTQVAYNGSTWTETIVVMSEVGWMRRIVWSETRIDPRYGYMRKIAETTTETGVMTDMDNMLRIVYGYAASSVDMSLDARTGLTTLDYMPSGQESVYDVMTSIARWCPSVRASMDYSSNRWVWETLTQQPIVSLDSYRAQMTSIDVTPRYDLRPPSVSLTGGVQYSVGGSPGAIDAYVYHVPESQMLNSSYAGIGQAASAATKQRVVIRGRKIPRDFVLGVAPPIDNLPTRMSEEMASCWSAFPNFSGLSHLVDAVNMSPLYVQVMQPEEVYPPEQTNPGEDPNPDYEVPANYDTLSYDTTKWLNASIMIDGTFPASVDQRQNIHELRWCKAKLTQYAAMVEPVNNSLAVDVDAIFNSRGVCTIGEGAEASTAERAISVMTADVILISDPYRSYYPEDLSLGSNDPYVNDYEPVVPEYPDYPSVDQLKQYADQYYRETRSLVTEGSITICGYRDDPRPWVSSRVSLAGVVDATPVQSCSCDLMTETLTLTLGDRGVLGIDDHISRYTTTVAAIREAAEAADNPWRYQAEVPMDQDTADALSPQTISPLLTAHVSAGSPVQRDVYPFTVYKKGSKSYLKGGVQQTLSGPVSIEDLDISDYVEEGQEWVITRRLNKETRQFELVPMYRSNQGGSAK